MIAAENGLDVLHSKFIASLMAVKRLINLKHSDIS